MLFRSCYLGGSWPAEYHGKLIIGNIHGQRLNMDVPVRDGSGYIGKHAPDFINFNDRWSQTLNQQIDQDGNVFVIDWYDKQQCHNQGNPAVHDRSNGRIFKISYGEKKGTKIDLGKLSSPELSATLRHANAWQARHGARLLQERGPDKALTNELREALRLASAGPTGATDGLPKTVTATPVQLRALWALHATGGLDQDTALATLKHPGEHLRAWTIQLLCEDKNPGDAALKEFARLAKEDPSPVVRLYLASACQRLTVAQRAPIIEALLAHAEDAADHNLPLMYWYATEPLVAADPAKGALLLAKAKIPVLREYITRRLTAK